MITQNIPLIFVILQPEKITIMPDSTFSSFLTQGFEGVITPLVRDTHEVLVGWNLILLAAVLLLVVINKQTYPHQFRQLLSVPGGTAHTNQLLREWNPTRSFIGFTSMVSYMLVMALFAQKALVILSRDVSRYNGFDVFLIALACVAGWVVLRLLAIVVMGWLFRQSELVVRQLTIELSVDTLCFLLFQPILWLILYVPNTIFIYIGFGLLMVSALLKLVLEYIDTRLFYKIPSFYIFLYFCTLEIVPLTLLLVAGFRGVSAS